VDELGVILLILIIWYIRSRQVRTHPWRRVPAGWHPRQSLAVKDGWGWWYRKYAPLDTELEQLEKNARGARKGLWGDSVRVRRGSGGNASAEGKKLNGLLLGRV
jgi:hypothetical protein